MLAALHFVRHQRPLLRLILGARLLVHAPLVECRSVLTGDLRVLPSVLGAVGGHCGG